MNLKVGFLGMADNVASRSLLDELQKQNIYPQLIILEQSRGKGLWKRIIRKLRNAGLRQTIHRIVDGAALLLRNRGIEGKSASIGTGNVLKVVRDLNGVDCQKMLTASKVDILILCTDSLIKRSIFSIPRLGAINAHPGWIPTYRGIGSKLAMLRDGFLPAISVHFIDEGVDTGPLVCRETIYDDVIGFGQQKEANWRKAQARMFAKALILIDNPQYQEGFSSVDLFYERSNMTLGISNKQAKEIMRNAQRDQKRLTAFENQNVKY